MLLHPSDQTLVNLCVCTYWADLKPTYVYVRIGPDSEQTKACKYLGFGLELTSSRRRTVSNQEPTYILQCTGSDLDPTYLEGPIHLNHNTSSLRINNHVTTSPRSSGQALHMSTTYRDLRRAEERMS